MKLGVDTIKSVFAGIIGIADQVATILDDGKIELIELPQLAIVTTTIPGLVQTVKQALPEFKDLDATEAKEVADYIQLNFDIQNDDLEAVIEQAVHLVAESYDVIFRGIDAYRGWRNWASEIRKEAA